MCTKHQRFVIYNLSILGLIFILLGVSSHLLVTAQKNIDRDIEDKSWKTTKWGSIVAIIILLITIGVMVYHKAIEIYKGYSISIWYFYVQPGDWLW